MPIISDDLSSAIDEGFRKLLNSVGVRSDGFNLTDGLDEIQDTPLTIYVATNGDDNNVGTEAQPFRTIQAAIDSLHGKVLRNVVTIRVGVGSFAGFLVDLNLIKTTSGGPDVNVPGVATQLNIIGTFVTPTLTTGTVSGTGIATVVNLAGVLTDGTQNWTIDELKGRYVLMSSGLYLPIVSNTATALTVASSFFTGTTYSIWDIGTLIDSGDAYTSGAGPGTSVARIGVTGDGSTAGSAEIYIERLAVQFASTTNVGLRVSGSSRSSIRNVSIIKTGGGASSCISLSGTISFTLDSSYIYRSDTSGALLSLLASNQNLSPINCYLRGGSAGITSATTTAGMAFLTSNTFDGCLTGIALQGGRFDCQLSTANRFLNCPVALAVGTSSFGTAPSLSCSTAATMFFSGCTTILNAICGRASLGVCSGSGNTNGIVATLGARVQISNTGALGVSSNELSVDGVTGTLATLRGNSPKVFPLVPNPYGTYVYE